MLGERVPARQALEWGLIDRVSADDEFEAEVDALAERLATGPTRAYAGTKRAAQRLAVRRIDEQLELEAAIQQELAALGRLREGVEAFAEKREPRFAGAEPCPPRSGEYTRASLYGRARCLRRAPPRRRAPPLLAPSSSAAPAASRGLLAPGGGRLAERRQHPHAVLADLRPRRWSCSSASRAC